MTGTDQGKQPNFTRLADWREWFSTCTAFRCSAEARERFSKFAYKRYEKYLFSRVRDYLGEERIPVEVADLRDPENVTDGVQACWADIEGSHWHGRPLRPERSPEDWSDPSRTYKAVYQERAAHIADEDQCLGFLEAKTTANLIQTRCASLLRAAMHPLNSQRSEEASAAEEAVQADTTSHADAEALANEIFDSLQDREKHLYWTYLNGIPHNEDRLLNAIGIKKSAAYEAFERAKQILKKALAEDEGGPEEALAMLACLKERLREWAETVETPYLEKGDHDPIDPQP